MVRIVRKHDTHKHQFCLLAWDINAVVEHTCGNCNAHALSGMEILVHNTSVPASGFNDNPIIFLVIGCSVLLLLPLLLLLLVLCVGETGTIRFESPAGFRGLGDVERGGGLFSAAAGCPPCFLGLV